MSKGLRHYPSQQIKAVAMRRMSGNTKGCGYWGAFDYINKKPLKEAKKVGATA